MHVAIVEVAAKGLAEPASFISTGLLIHDRVEFVAADTTG